VNIAKFLKAAARLADGWPAIVRDNKVVVPKPHAWLELDVATCGCDCVVEVEDLAREYPLAFDVHAAAEACAQRSGAPLLSPPPPAGECLVPPGPHGAAIARIYPVASRDPSRSCLMGVWLNGGFWRASDGYRAAMVESSRIVRRLGIPSSVARFLELCGRDAMAFSVPSADGTCYATGEGWRLAFTTLDPGCLPDYWSPIPTGGEVATATPSASLLRMLRGDVRLTVDGGVFADGVRLGPSTNGRWSETVSGKFLADAPRVLGISGRRGARADFYDRLVVFRGNGATYAVAAKRVKKT